MTEKMHGFVISSEYSLALEPKIVRDAIAFLDASKYLHLFTTRELASRLGRTQGRFNGFAAVRELSKYRYQNSSRRVFWGSRKTIAELKRRVKKLERRPTDC